MLPENVRNEFNEVLAGPVHYTCDDFVIWFKEKGYTISRSSVHRYLVANKKVELSKKQLQKSDVLNDSILSLRLECLNLAFSVSRDTDLAKLKKDADDIFNWMLFVLA